MVLPDYLTIPRDVDPRGVTCLLGETGMTLAEAGRPVARLAGWMHSGALPPHACAMFEADERFRGIAGLLGVFAEPDAFSEYRAAWLLARASAKLVSIVVRDAQGCRIEQLREDVRFALRQSERYCACRAVVIVQAATGDAARSEPELLRAVFGRRDVVPGQIYDDGAAEGLSYAWLADAHSPEG